MDKNRSPEELTEMVGSLDDLKQVESEGFEGHRKGGADIKFITKTEQGQRKKEAEEKRLAKLTEMEKKAVEYIKSHAQLVADKNKILLIAQNQNNQYDQSLVNSARYKKEERESGVYGFDEKSNYRKTILVFLTSEGDYYKVIIDEGIIPKGETRTDTTIFLRDAMSAYLGTKRFWLSYYDDVARLYNSLSDEVAAFEGIN